MATGRKRNLGQVPNLLSALLNNRHFIDFLASSPLAFLPDTNKRKHIILFFSYDCTCLDRTFKSSFTKSWGKMTMLARILKMDVVNW